MVFNIREDDFAGIKLGAPLDGSVPALGNRQVRLVIDTISPRGDYATWRATRQSSGYDVRTFEVRARPQAPIEGLRPGMSVLVAAALTMATAGLRAVVSRELRYLGRQPWDLALLLWFPAATLALLLWLFSNGVPTGLPIAVVDEDHSSASRDLIRRMASMRGLAVTAQPASLEAAQPLVRSGAVYGVVHIPSNWERDRLRNAPQPVVLYENAQFSLVAGIIGGDVRAAVSSMVVERAVASEARFGGGLAQAAARLGGVQADLRTLFNPSPVLRGLLGRHAAAGGAAPVLRHRGRVCARARVPRPQRR